MQEENSQAIRTVMAEGEDHYRTFLAIQEWLAPYSEPQYLRAADLEPPPASDQDYKNLQQQYRDVLELLRDGYQRGLPNGGNSLNRARMGMLAPSGLDVLAEKIASRGFLVVFETPAGKSFQPVEPP